MTRLLLTLLALLAGLVAQTAPAQARIGASSGAEIGVVEAPQSAVRGVVPGQTPAGFTTRLEAPSAAGNCPEPPRISVYIPTVHTGIDRARE